MHRPWFGAAGLVLALAGCGDGDGGGPSDTPERAPQTVEAAEVGDRPTEPLAGVEGVGERPPRPTVIASGQTPGGESFEVVLYGTTEGICVATLFPARKIPGGGGACSESIPPRLDSIPILASRLGTIGGHLQEATGWVGPQVESVVVRFELEGETETLDAVTEQLPRGLLRKAGAREPLGIFIAFPPASVNEDDLAAIAYDADGDSLGRATWAITE